MQRLRFKGKGIVYGLKMRIESEVFEFVSSENEDEQCKVSLRVGRESF